MDGEEEVNNEAARLFDDDVSPTREAEEEEKDPTPAAKPTAKPAPSKRIEFHAMRVTPASSPSAHGSTCSMEVVIPIRRKVSRLIADWVTLTGCTAASGGRARQGGQRQGDQAQPPMWKVQEPEEGVHWASKPDVQRVPEIKGQVRQIQRTRREGWHRRGEGQGARYVVTGLSSTHTDESSARPAPKIHKKASTRETIEVSDDDEPGPSRG